MKNIGLFFQFLSSLNKAALTKASNTVKVECIACPEVDQFGKILFNRYEGLVAFLIPADSFGSS